MYRRLMSNEKKSEKEKRKKIMMGDYSDDIK
jgi:hypothetical protein